MRAVSASRRLVIKHESWKLAVLCAVGCVAERLPRLLAQARAVAQRGQTTSDSGGIEVFIAKTGVGSDSEDQRGEEGDGLFHGRMWSAFTHLPRKPSAPVAEKVNFFSVSKLHAESRVSVAAMEACGQQTAGERSQPLPAQLDVVVAGAIRARKGIESDDGHFAKFAFRCLENEHGAFGQQMASDGLV